MAQNIHSFAENQFPELFLKNFSNLPTFEQKTRAKLLIDLLLFLSFHKQLPHKYRYFAIFDGHVNEQAAEYCKNNLHLHLIQNDKFKEGHISDALREVFIQTDKEFCDRIANESMRAGTTALVCLIEDERRLYLAWAGDSTCILIRDGEPVQLTHPHTAELESERDRIKQMGGDCIYTNMWRVMGILAVSRSIGDPDYKPYVTAEPEIVQLDLVGNEDFLVLASDGLWDTLTPEDASTIVYEFLALNADQQVKQPGKVIDEVSRLLIQRSIEEGSSDNITTIVLFLKDLAKISPPIQTKQNGHQNGHVNGNGLHGPNEPIKENGGGFPLNVNATPFSPNNDLFASISTSGVDLIRQQRERTASEDSNGQRPANPINITSNEDNTYFDDNLSAINDEMVCNDDEEPHSILPNINQELTNESKQFDDEDDLQRELDEERVVVETIGSEPPMLEEDEEEKELEEKDIEVKEPEEKEVDLLERQQDDANYTEVIGKPDEVSRDLDDQEPVDVEYKLVPGESTASPVDLISESTTDQNEEKGSSEHLHPASPFEQIDDQQVTNDVVIKVNDETLNTFDETATEEANDSAIETQEATPDETQEEIQEAINDERQEETELIAQPPAEFKPADEDDEETSFEFLDNTEVGPQPNDPHNITQYISPEKMVDLQELSVYENANPTFDNSALNSEMHMYRDDDAREPEDDYQNHPFENDSEDSIKYLDKTATDENQLQTSGQVKAVDDLADLIQSASLGQASEPAESIAADRTLNLFMLDQNDENIEEQNKENLPERILLASASTNLLDATLLPLANDPMMPIRDQSEAYSVQINENFDEQNDEQNDEEEDQPRSSDFETIKKDEMRQIVQRPPPDLEITNNKTEDMDITFLQQRTMPLETTTVIDKQVPNYQDNEIHEDNAISEQSPPEEERNDEEERDEEQKEEPTEERKEKDSFVIHEPPVEPVVEESKDNFEVLEAPPTIDENAEPEQLVTDELNRDSNDQLSELKTESTSAAPESNDKPEIVDEQPKKEPIEEPKEELVHNEIKIGEVAAGAVLAASAVAVTTQVAKKTVSASKPTAAKTSLTSKATPTKKPLSTTKTPSATKPTPNSSKLTKDSKPAPVKDSKSALARETKSSTVRSALTSKPLTKKPAGTTSAAATAATTKPAATRKLLTTTASTRQPLSTSTKPAAAKPALSRAPATSATASTLAAKPTASKVSPALSARLTGSAAKPAAKSTVSTRPTSTLASKATANSKPTTGTSRPASTVNKYANVTSRVSSTIAKSSAPSTGLTKKPLGSTSSSALRTAPTKPSGTLTSRPTAPKAASTAASRASAPSRITSKPLAGVTSKVTASKPATTKLAASKPTASKPTTSSASATANKKTAVPRKPVNKPSIDSPKQAAPEPPATENVNENNGSIKPNGLFNGQSNGGILTNDDQPAVLLNATTPTSMPASITASKSRDKLTNSLKAELEAAMELNGNGLPK